MVKLRGEKNLLNQAMKQMILAHLGIGLMGLTKVHQRGSDAQSFQKIPKNENQKIADSDEILFQGCSLIAVLRIKIQLYAL